MNDKEALAAHARGEKLDQPAIERLYGLRYIEAQDVSHMLSVGKELLPTFITEKGRKFLES